MLRFVPKWNAARIAALALACSARFAAAGERPVDFNRDIRPVLSDKCFKCHGPDETARKAGLRLDHRDSALLAKKGEAPIVPGNPGRSQLVARIRSDDSEERMPPPESNKTLTAAQMDLLESWILEGAVYAEHWAFAPPLKREPPAVRQIEWVRNPIDAFILARLEQAGLAPSPEADPYALVRRLYLDLIGFAPTPAEADAYVHDPRPDAYERLVDTLLQSAHYGERWARRWLDLARYADTNGYEKDRTRNIWPFRDWVIRALNADMPFDQFTIEQLAGDLLPDPTLDQRIATGFHRNTMLNEEGGIDPLEFRFHAMTDRVATTGTTWLGLTVMCAQCHTHKYDPITHRDYYRFMAFLNNADEPEIALPDPRKDRDYQLRMRQADALSAALPDHWPLPELEWLALKPESISTASGEAPTRLDDGSVLFAAPGSERDTYTLVLEPLNAPVERLRLDALTHESLPNQGPGRVAHGNFVLSEITITATASGDASSPQPVRVASAKADQEQDGFPAGNAIDGNSATGWAVHDPTKPLNRNHHLELFLDKPVGAAEGTRLTVTLAQEHGTHHTLGRVRLSVPNPEKPDPRPVADRRREAVDRAFQAWLNKARDRTVRWVPLRPAEAKSNMPLLTVEEDLSVFASGDTTKQDTYELVFRGVPEPIAAIRLEALPDERLPAHGPGMTYYEGEPGDFFLGELRVTADGEQVSFASASESYSKNRFGGAPVTAQLAVDGDPQTGWSVSGRVGERHVAVFVAESPIPSGAELRVSMLFGRHFASSLGRFRFSVTRENGAEARDLPEELEPWLALPESQWTSALRERLFESFLLRAPELEEQAKRIRNLRRPPNYQTTLALRERPPEHPRPTHLHHRGEYLQPKESVDPGVPEILPALPSDSRPDRLAFARWLVSRDNPLTARVTVNRQWAALFGQGIVRTVQDFGLQGDSPTHPELLDWLAVEFMENGWSLKQIHQLMVTSATYRQSSSVVPESLSADPDNRLLSRAPRLRVEAEILRDQILRAAGLLSETMFGPPVRPPQPEGVTEVAYGSPAWTADEGRNRYRRSLYTFQKRTAPFAMFNTFDAPSGEACVARRDVSNSPLQALTLLNDVMLVEAAQALGKQIAALQGEDEARVTSAFRAVLTRPPTAAEVELLTSFARTQRQRFTQGDLNASKVAGVKGDGPPGLEAAVWTAVARALFNLDEAVTKG